MLGAGLVDLPVHAGGALVIDLHAIASDVTAARLGTARDNHRPGYETSAVLRPAFHDGKTREREVPALDHILHGTAPDRFGKERPHFGELGPHPDFIQ